MSIESVAIALHHSRARGTAKLVLLGIANHDGDGGAWPSLATLAKYAGGVDPRNVRKALRELEVLGEIRTHLQAGGTGRTANYERPNLYDFLLRCPEGCDRSSQHRVPTPGRIRPQGEDASDRGPRTDSSPKPSCEPSPQPSSGSNDHWATKPPREQAQRKPRTTKPRALTHDEMQADFASLRELCLQELQDDPVSVWWTLRYEHGAIRPAAFMRRLVEFGEWDGFVGSHGISEYLPNGASA